MRKAGLWLGLTEADDEYDPRADEFDGDRSAAYAPGAGQRIATVHPTNFHGARQLAEYFRDGIPVIMNLTEMDQSDAQRVVDFAAGLTFGLRGSLDRIAHRVFLLVPAHVVVTTERRGRHDDRFLRG